MTVWGPGALPFFSCFSYVTYSLLPQAFWQPILGTPRKAFCGNGQCPVLHLSFNGGWRYNWPMVVWSKTTCGLDWPSLHLEKKSAVFQLTPACLTPSGGLLCRTRLVRCRLLFTTRDCAAAVYAGIESESTDCIPLSWYTGRWCIAILYTCSQHLPASFHPYMCQILWA